MYKLCVCPDCCGGSCLCTFTWIQVDTPGLSLTEAVPHLPESIPLPASECLCKTEACICLNLDMTGAQCPRLSMHRCTCVCPACAFVSYSGGGLPSHAHACRFAWMPVFGTPESTCECMPLCIGDSIKLTHWGLCASLLPHPLSRLLSWVFLLGS